MDRKCLDKKLSGKFSWNLFFLDQDQRERGEKDSERLKVYFIQKPSPEREEKERERERDRE